MSTLEILPRYRYSKSGEKIDNITDWALGKFRERYGKIAPPLASSRGLSPGSPGVAPAATAGDSGHKARNDGGEAADAGSASASALAPAPASSRHVLPGSTDSAPAAPARDSGHKARNDGGGTADAGSASAQAPSTASSRGLSPGSPDHAPAATAGDSGHKARNDGGESGAERQAITKDDIFHYVYGVLHDPVYRETYAINLKREFPRIPFYPDFRQWAEWGERLMQLHIGYEEVAPWPLERIDTPDEKARTGGVAAKAMLKADKDNGSIRLDSETQLTGIPGEVWTYRLGNRSGFEWILDQYKEKKPKDPTIREKFDTYRFADYKEKVIDLLMRVTRVSVETVAITDAMAALNRDGWEK